MQGIVDGGADQRDEVEQARNRVDRRDQVRRQRGVDRGPVGGKQTGRKMSTRGMAANDQLSPNRSSSRVAARICWMI